MARSVKEWVGKNDDSQPSEKCKLRILERQGRKCALTGKKFTPKDKPDFDHITPLWLGGKNREGNLQAILRDPHKRKTAAEATVRAKVTANTAKHLLVRPASKIKSAPFPKSAKPKHDRVSLPPRSLFWPSSPNPEIRDAE